MIVQQTCRDKREAAEADKADKKKGITGANFRPLRRVIFSDAGGRFCPARATDCDPPLPVGCPRADSARAVSVILAGGRSAGKRGFITW